MLLLDDGTRFTNNTVAATRSAKASRPVALNWWHRVRRSFQPPTPVFLDFVVQPVMAWQSVRQQPVRQQSVRQQPVHQRSFLEAISSHLSALPPPAAR